MKRQETIRLALIHLFVLILVLIGPSVHADTDTGPGVLQSLIEEALRNNPELKAYSEQVEALKERTAQARSLDNPRLGLAIANLPVDSFRFDQEPMTQKVVSLKQKIPFPGKLDLKGELAEKDKGIARKEYEEKRNQTVSKVKTVYYDLVFLQKALDLTENNRELLKDFIKTAETGYAVGALKQRDIVKARLQLSNIIKKVLSLEKQKDIAEARLTTLLGRRGREEIVVEDTGSTSLNMPLDHMFGTAVQNRPGLAKLVTAREKALLAKKLAEEEFYPDFDFGVSYGQRDDSDSDSRPDFFSAGVTISIPLWYKNRESRKVSEKTANARRAEELYLSMKNDLYYQLSSIYSEVNQLDQEIELIKTGLIPQSTISFESALSEYKVQKTGFLDLVRSLIDLYNYELDYHKAVSMREKKLAELEATVGQKLFWN